VEKILPEILLFLGLAFCFFLFLALSREARKRQGVPPDDEDPADWWKKGKKTE